MKAIICIRRITYLSFFVQKQPLNYRFLDKTQVEAYLGMTKKFYP